MKLLKHILVLLSILVLNTGYTQETWFQHYVSYNPPVPNFYGISVGRYLVVKGLVCGSNGYVNQWMEGASDMWYPITSAPITSKNLYAVILVDSSNVIKAYCVGQSGIILKTNLVGNFPNQTSFYIQNSPVTRSLNSVCFTAYNTGIAVGDTGTVVRTIDGGSHWTTITPITTNSLFSVNFPVTNTGYAVGANGIVIKSTDNGLNWVIKAQPLNDSLRSVWFTSDNIGFVVSRNGAIFKTTDGGNSWQSKPSNTTQHLRSIQFLNANTGYAAGYNKTILKTTNNGENWVVQTVNFTNHNYNCLSIESGGKVLVAGNNACAAGNFMDFMDTPEISVIGIFTIYPNPAQNHITINLQLPHQTKDINLSIYNLQGQKLIQQPLQQSSTELNITQLPNGIYIAKLTLNDGTTAQKKFVVVK